MKKAITLLASLVLAGALSAVSFARQDQSSQPSPNTAQPGTDPSASQPATPPQDSSAATQTSFTGTVVKAGDKFALNTADTTYQLDDQQKAKPFTGQQVKVSGSLDDSTGTIHVSDISPAP